MMGYNSAMIRVESQSIEQTMAIGKAIGELARPGDVIALVGELGAGKTQFVRGLASARGVSPGGVASPTFVIVHEYSNHTGDLALIHIDAYRISTLDDLETIGWDRGFPEMRDAAPVVIEWADRIETELESDALFIRMAHAGDTVRDVQIDVPHAWRERIAMVQSKIESQEIPS